jgi:hypothetical protein
LPSIWPGCAQDTLNEPLQLQRTGRSHDELSDLVEGVNQLQGSLSNYLEQQQRYEKELADHRDRLAQMVDARTIELQEANARLQGLARTDALTGLPNRRHFDELQTNRDAADTQRKDAAGAADLRCRFLQGIQRSSGACRMGMNACRPSHMPCKRA